MPFYPHPHTTYPFHKHTTNTNGLAYPTSSSPHAHPATPQYNQRAPAHTTTSKEHQTPLQPKSTIASILVEKNTGKTTVTGALSPGGSDILDSVVEGAAGDGCSGVEALDALCKGGVPPVLDVWLVFTAMPRMDGSGVAGLLDGDGERAVYDALGLVSDAGMDDGRRSEVDGMGDVVGGALVKTEPEWIESCVTREEEPIKTEPSNPTLSTRPSAAPARFRPFRPTSSKMAIFESQTQKRKQGMNGRRGMHQQRVVQSDAADQTTSPSTIFSRTRSRTRLGMGGTMLEQVVNVSNVVRLARKNPSALVERFLKGQPATSPVKTHNGKPGGGFTIDDAVPNRGAVGAAGSGGVKTLNIATGSSKKRKVVSVVLDDEGRPVRWGAGMAAAAEGAAAVVGGRNEGVGDGRGKDASSTATTVTKKTEAEPLVHFGRNLPICSNCGITESSSWRTKGKGGQRVCNGESPVLSPVGYLLTGASACGLYWNNKGKMRPKELWEKDIARWKKRRAKAAEKMANAGTSNATGTPASNNTVAKSEPASSRRPSVPATSVKITQGNAGLAPPQSTGTSLKRNLSAIAEKEAQLRADQRKSHVAGPRVEQLATAGAMRNKENVHDQRQPSSSHSGNPSESHRLAASALQPVNVNGNTHPSVPLLQQIKESPEAVLKRYLGETPFSLVPANHMPLSDDGSRGSRANTRTRSPATSPTEVGSVRHSQEEAIEWGTAPDLAGLFRLSQQAESVGSVATTVHRPQEHGVSSTEPDVGGHLGSDEFTMMEMEMDDQQDALVHHENTDFDMETDPFGADLSSAPYTGESSPARQPFDWKDLPPSSPPVMYDDEVDHAAALWSSSPETSPVDFGTISVKEISPMKPVGEEMQEMLQSLERSAQAEALRLINESG